MKFKHLGTQGVVHERDLQTVIAELQVQDGLEWRAISGRVAPEEVAPELSSSRERASELLLANDDDDGKLLELHEQYGVAVDALLGLLAAGRPEEALEIDEAEVDPAFEEVVEELRKRIGDEAAQARRARRLSDVGLVLTVLLGIALTTLIQSRRKRDEIRQQAEFRSEARYRALITQSTDLIMVADREGTLTFCSPSANRLLGAVVAGSGSDDSAGLDASASMNLFTFLSASDQAALAELMQHVEPNRAISTIELSICDRKFEFSIQDLMDTAAVGGLLLTGHDVTQQRTLQAELEHRALHDTLTGLPNRALLGDRFDQAIRSAKRTGASVGLLLIDLDRFKEINDTFGHHYGDALLTQIAPRLGSVLRSVDTVARLGGDEFAVLLPQVNDLASVTALAHRIQEVLHRPFRVEEVDLDVEASIGAVISGEHGAEASLLMQRADIAMYLAKNQKLGVATYDPTVDNHSPGRLALLGDLRRALPRHELALHYQPKVSITTGDVVGAEALVRWQHPEHGLLLPDTFIALAEQSGVIGPLTEYVISAALTQARTWADIGHPLPVSVNVSARNLLDESLPDLVDQLLADHGVSAELLELEVTESAIMIDQARAQRLLERLAGRGVRVSIDDFGVGYTSVAHLKNLPITELKIDKSFVVEMLNDPSNALIVQSVVDLGHNLGLTLVAEGVEDADTLAALARLGCDVAQGYYLSQPLVAVKFDEWRADRPGLLTAGPVSGDGRVLYDVHGRRR